MRSDDSSEPGGGRDERDPVSDSFRGGSEDESKVRETFGRSADRRGFLKLAGAVVAAPFATGRASAADAHELVVRTTEDPSELSYEFTATEQVTPLLDEGDDSAEESNDRIEQNDDGTWTVSGYTGNGYGDAFAFEGEIVSFAPASGPFELRLDGEEVSLEALVDDGYEHRIEVVTTEDPSELSFEFETTGEASPVHDGGRNAAERANDEVTTTDDGTWRVSGYTGNGYGDAFDYNGDVVDFAPTTGPFEVRVDGQTVDVESLTGGAEAAQTPDGSDDEPEDTGPIVGGGAGYAETVPESHADVVVSTASELATALDRAGSGDVVYVAGGAEIDLGGRELTVPAGATLASDRGIDGAAGGRLRTGREVWPSFDLQRDARVTGIRFSGPHFEYTPHDPGVGIGLWARGRDVEIDNCELWGFSHAAVRAIGGTHVHHNHVHHNPMDGLGYGVLCKGGHPVIEYNEMDYNRHSVASDGSGGYTVRYNHFGPNAIDHVIDCHRPGGTTIEVHNNTVEATTQVQNDQLPPAVAIRGVPDDTARIEDNWFHNPEEPRSTPSGWTDEAIVQVHTSGWRNVDFSGNAYGSDEPDEGIGCPR